jgi:alkylresorcinol/alkylpyrone synthase
MFITGIGTAAPPHRYAQRECWETFAGSPLSERLNPRARAIVRKVLNGNNGIATRHLALDPLEQAFDLSPDALHARFTEHAPLLATEAAQRALQQAEVRPGDIDALIISTCTGYLCPGLTSYVSERLGLPSHALALDLVGQGCGAALPNLRTADALLGSGRCERVLSICVEVCSAALYFDNDPGVLISACLFGDGAGAAVLERSPNGTRRMEWKTSSSLLQPSDRDLLRFEQKAGALRNVLTPQVPALAARHAQGLLAKIVADCELAPEKIIEWIMHPGGRDVLKALREHLDLREKDTRWSEAILSEFGNLSSSSIFFVLEAALKGAAPGGYWAVCSFGAGFSCHGALLEVE